MANALRDYIESLFVSGNDVPVERITITVQSWDVIKAYMDHDLPLDSDRIEIERIYRSKTAQGLRAFSPLADALAKRTDENPAGPETVMVPREPTTAMLVAAWNTATVGRHPDEDRHVWRAMVAAAESPAVRQEPKCSLCQMPYADHKGLGCPSDNGSYSPVTFPLSEKP